MNKKQVIFLLVIIFLGMFYWQYPQYFKHDYWFPEKKVSRMPKMFWATYKDNNLDSIVDLQTGDRAILIDRYNQIHWYIYSVEGKWEEQPLRRELNGQPLSNND